MKKRINKSKALCSILIGIGALSCITIVICAAIFRNSGLANLFTAVSGCIGGVATITIGFIAFRQNEVIKEESDKMLIKPDFFVNDIIFANSPDSIDKELYIISQLNHSRQYFFILNNYMDKPIFRLRPIFITYEDTNGKTKKNFDSYGGETNRLLIKGEEKIIILKLPDQDVISDEIIIMFSFEDAYQNRYKKEVLLSTKFLPNYTIKKQFVSEKEK